MHGPHPHRAASAALGLLLVLGAGQAAAETIFLSTQLRPIEEAEKFRAILDGAGQEVEFVPEEVGPFTTRLQAEMAAGQTSVDLLGALHGDLPPVIEGLDSVDDVMAKLGDRGFIEAFAELGKLGTDHQVYVPWIQASYIMAASRQALDYLPDGAELDRLTYSQLGEWGENIAVATGERRLGFPAGPKGLMHRFLQGYLYPSYTGGVVRPFKSAEAETMWAEFKRIWESTSPRSTSYAFMQEPLLAGEVWVAFDHTARLLDAFKQKPDEFVAFPAPAGPAGRGFMPVVAGLAIPKGAPQRAAAAELIDFLTRPETQVATLQAVGFYPVIDVALPADLEPGIKLAADAISAQASAPDAVPSLLPVGLGEQGGELNKVFLDTFQLIVLRGAEVRATIDEQGAKLAALMAETGAACWEPDAPSEGACPVE
jgi:multiple sugar transport system substrate-binding protein